VYQTKDVQPEKEKQIQATKPPRERREPTPVRNLFPGLKKKPLAGKRKGCGYTSEKGRVGNCWEKEGFTNFKTTFWKSWRKKGVDEGKGSVKSEK